MTRSEPVPASSLSIGQLSAATGITLDTLRAWERRYGKPRPHRLPSGHRRYDAEHVRWLRQVAEALALGHRPAEAIVCSDRELAELIAASRLEAEPCVPMLLGLVRDSDVRSLERELDHYRDHLGARPWLSRVVVPLLAEIGRAWADSCVEIRHERLATEVIDSALRAASAAHRVNGEPRVLVATLPNERHALGLQLVSLCCALNDVPSRVLGPDVPIEQCAASAVELRARVLAISVSLANSSATATHALRELRATLPGDCELVIGGQGARRLRAVPDGIHHIESLDRFDAWLLGRDT